MPPFVWQHGVAAIHLAAWFGSLDILKLLVQAGAEQKMENEVKYKRKIEILFSCFKNTLLGSRSSNIKHSVWFIM